MSAGATSRRERRNGAGALSRVDRSPGLQPPPGLELSFVWIDGEELAVLSHPVDEPVPLEGLTAAERQVAADVLAGLSNDQIARQRGTATGTIAKQVAAIFRKAGVGSRRQLAASIKKTARSQPPASCARGRRRSPSS